MSRYISSFVAGGVAFWIGEVAEHALHNMALAVIIAGLTGVVTFAVSEKVTQQI